MEEIEDPTEMIREQIHHQAEHGHDNWMSQIALSSAIIAVLAAVSVLFSGHHANEAMREQIHSSDQWAHYQAKSIKSLILNTKRDVMKEFGKNPPAKDAEKVAEYQSEQTEISKSAKEKEEASDKHMTSHLVFARAVTLFQIAIAISAISALVRRRKYWYLALGFAGLGLFFFIHGVVLTTLH